MRRRSEQSVVVSVERLTYHENGYTTTMQPAGPAQSRDNPKLKIGQIGENHYVREDTNAGFQPIQHNAGRDECMTFDEVGYMKAQLTWFLMCVPSHSFLIGYKFDRGFPLNV